MEYPANDFQNKEKLLNVLGTHWTNTYGGKDFVEEFVRSRGELEDQNHINLTEACDLLSRLDAPVYHKEKWLRVVLKESDRRKRPIKYGDGTVYGEQPITGQMPLYGGSLTAAEYVFPLTQPLVFSQLAQNKISEPSLSWFHGIDFTLNSDGSAVIFKTDPFADSNLVPVEIFDGDVVTDREITLWFKNADLDKNYLYTHIGYAVNIYGKSSESYKNLLNAYIDSLVTGATKSSFEKAVASMLGVRVVQNDQEVVELIDASGDNLVIVTDKEAYLFNVNDTATVSVGDTVYKGQLLTSAASVHELNTGVIPSGVVALNIGSDMMSGYIDGVMFCDTTVNTVVEENVDGKTKISFDLVGHPSDVEKFWDDVHAEGIRRGATLAELLDTRGYPPPYEPTAATLPTTVNPLAFLIKNILRFNAFVVKIDLSMKMPGAFGINQVDLIRRMTPPWTALFLITTGTQIEPPVNLTQPGDETEAGGSESLSTFIGAEPVEESVTGSDHVSERVRLAVVEGFCR